MVTLEQIKGAADLSPEEMTALLALPERYLRDLTDEKLSDEDRKNIIAAWRMSEAPAPVSGWDTFLKVAAVIGSIAGAVSGISGAATSVAGLVSAIKAQARTRRYTGEKR